MERRKHYVIWKRKYLSSKNQYTFADIGKMISNFWQIFYPSTRINVRVFSTPDSDMNGIETSTFDFHMILLF